MAASVISAVRGGGEGCLKASPKFFKVAVVTGEAFGPISAKRPSSSVSVIHEARGVKQ